MKFNEFFSTQNVSRPINILPEDTKISRIRSRFQFKEKSPHLEIRPVGSWDEALMSFRLVHDSYCKVGFMLPDPSGMRMLPQHKLSQSTIIIAKWEGRIVATSTIVENNPLGLPMEGCADLSSLRRKLPKLAEISSLAVHPEFRVKTSEILFHLIRYNYLYSHHIKQVDAMVFAVNPSMADFYKAIHCHQFASASSYALANGAPANYFYLNCREWAQNTIDSNILHFMNSGRNEVVKVAPKHFSLNPMPTYPLKEKAVGASI